MHGTTWFNKNNNFSNQIFFQNGIISCLQTEQFWVFSILTARAYKFPVDHSAWRQDFRVKIFAFMQCKLYGLTGFEKSDKKQTAHVLCQLGHAGHGFLKDGI